MPTGRTCLWSFVLALVPLALPGAAAAQTQPSVDARTWRPSTDPGAGIVYEPVTTPGPGVWNAGLWLSYAYHPVTLRHEGSSDVAFRPLEQVLGLDLVTGIGITKWASFGVDVPLFLHQTGSGGLPNGVVSDSQVPAFGLGDVTLTGKATLISNRGPEGLQTGFGLAALANVGVPTGDRKSFSGEGSTTVSARLLAEYAYIVANIQASVGYKLRTAEHTWPDASLGGVTFGDEIPWTFAITLRPKVLGEALDSGDRQRWELGAHGWLPAGPVGPFGSGDPGSSRLSPVLLSAADRIALGHYHDAYALLGAEVGLTDAVGVPTFRVMASVGWAPRAHDQDNDGVPDDEDQCPELPEDRDGIDDSDGCPEDDADDDGIPDHEDACPRTPGVFWGVPKKNGCPGPDADGDGVADPVDACPRLKGDKTDDPKTNGCPGDTSDRDHDGVPDEIDRCPDQPEDKDGFEDDDGCPDPDNDGDGVPDADDACPQERGVPSRDPKLNGCPDPDRDGDGFANDVDQCPDAPEVFNGVRDDDGCPDEGGTPLVAVDAKLHVTLATPIRFAGTAAAPELDPTSAPTLRALALELNRHPEWTLIVGAQPGPDVAPKATAFVDALARLLRRPDAARAEPWDAVKGSPAGKTGLGLLIRSSRPHGEE